MIEIYEKLAEKEGKDDDFEANDNSNSAAFLLYLANSALISHSTMMHETSGDDEAWQKI